MSEITLWRLCVAHRASQAFAGEGSYRRGGRWNPRGLRVVYCADSRALAALEVLVNLDEKERLTQIKWVCLPVVLSVDLISKPEKVPADWRQYPYSAATQAFGAEWVRAQRSVALRVPSAVVPGEFNYLLNPAHQHFSKIKVGKPEPFSFDPRLA